MTAPDVGEPDPFVNDKGERCSVRVCPECWSTDGWDSSAKWCYDCSTKTPPVICDLYARATPPATTEDTNWRGKCEKIARITNAVFQDQRAMMNAIRDVRTVLQQHGYREDLATTETETDDG